MSTESTFAALPVRQRGALEIIDTALKLYRRYFGVLMGWSALTALLFVPAFLFTLGLGALLVYPLVPGATCCVIAGAVRGQRITFGQVWDFTKPRFGALVLVTFLSVLLMSLASGAISLLWGVISVAGALAFTAMNAPEAITVVIAVIGSVIGLVISLVLSAFAAAWLGLVPIIVCLEDDKRSSAALGRAWELMKGSWSRVLGLAALLAIAVIAVMGIVGGTMALFGSSITAIVDNPSDDMAVLGALFTFFGFFGFFLLFWNPVQTLILAVLYLDLRVRKEALDLEWNSYASAPPAPSGAPMATAVELNAVAATPDLTPASLSGSAPNATATELRPPTPTNQAATPPVSPTPMRPPTAPVTSETSSSFAPAPPAVSLNKDANSPFAPEVNAPKSSDFASTFDVGQTSDTLFSPDTEAARRGEPDEGK